MKDKFLQKQKHFEKIKFKGKNIKKGDKGKNPPHYNPYMHLKPYVPPKKEHERVQQQESSPVAPVAPRIVVPSIPKQRIEKEMESVTTDVAYLLDQYGFTDELNVFKPQAIFEANITKCCFCYIRNFRAKINSPNFASESEV